MTVKELIEKLKTFPEDYKVYLMWDDDNPLEGGADIEDVFTVNGSKVECNNAVYITRA